MRKLRKISLNLNGGNDLEDISYIEIFGHLHTKFQSFILDDDNVPASER